MKEAGIKIKKVGFSRKGWVKDYRVRTIRRAGKAAASGSR